MVESKQQPVAAAPVHPVDMPLTEDEMDMEEMQNNNDLDSSYGDDGLSAIYESVTPSIFAFPKENGRTYHAYEEGKYYLPNDEKEQNRMNVVYSALTWMFDKTLFFAPVQNPHMIVDMGTGTGIWAIDVGDKYPKAHVIGVDLSPIQPRWVPPNVEFRIDDIDKDWVFEEPFDLIHSRLCNGNAIRDWPKYLSESYRSLKPGGWVEAQEFDSLPLSDDDSFPPNSSILEWHQAFLRGFLLGGCNMRFSLPQIKDQMRAVGFVNITAIEFKWPMSPWPKDHRLKEVGALAMLSMLDGLEGLGLASFTRFLKMDPEEANVLSDKAKKEWTLRTIHGYWPLFVVYAQKPPNENSIN